MVRAAAGEPAADGGAGAGGERGRAGGAAGAGGRRPAVQAAGARGGAVGRARPPPVSGVCGRMVICA